MGENGRWWKTWLQIIGAQGGDQSRLSRWDKDSHNSAGCDAVGGDTGTPLPAVAVIAILYGIQERKWRHVSRDCSELHE